MGTLPEDNAVSNWEEELDLSEVRGKALVPEIKSMLRRHTDIWSGNLGEISTVEHRIDLEKGALRIKQALYRAGHTSRNFIKAQFDKIITECVVEPAHSGWTSPDVVVPNTDGTPRFCADYRKLNAITLKDSCSLPRMDDCIDSLDSASVFSTLDSNSGY